MRRGGAVARHLLEHGRATGDGGGRVAEREGGRRGRDGEERARLRLGVRAVGTRDGEQPKQHPKQLRRLRIALGRLAARAARSGGGSIDRPLDLRLQLRHGQRVGAELNGRACRVGRGARAVDDGGAGRACSLWQLHAAQRRLSHRLAERHALPASSLVPEGVAQRAGSTTRRADDSQLERGASRVAGGRRDRQCAAGGRRPQHEASADRTLNE
eukprot:6705876-Prymnesium_polylepis.1